ncbi:copper resistance protein CopC [Sphingomonas sp. Leaf407]|uniref:copper homeostasis periplasmic binding protein CopC n=1 Tax=unclassified Sphingomonas TaxID=196159 RepID=UPI0006FBA364|nr:MULTISPECIES: copper homeostasis periplasmic binding protein CopC [unclassified Sphingomonas]KQN40563.1 copper resistance protein CopC [Sphingomonas sp. Leaf42]KQT29918.1 copper resistance protein CopC [Sphingomonas sp. Leaf407]
MRHLIALVVPALLAAAPALAHPKLLAATPAAEATVPATKVVQLGFSEPLVAAFSGITIEMTDMPGMKMKSPMRMPLQTSVAADGKTLVATLARPLPRGSYRLDWHVVSGDTHRVNGSYAFKVK